MKASLTLVFNQELLPIIASKLEQWQEYVQILGAVATIQIEPEDPPTADLWQAAQISTSDSTGGSDG